MCKLSKMIRVSINLHMFTLGLMVSCTAVHVHVISCCVTYLVGKCLPFRCYVCISHGKVVHVHVYNENGQTIHVHVSNHFLINGRYSVVQNKTLGNQKYVYLKYISMQAACMVGMSRPLVYPC